MVTRFERGNGRPNLLNDADALVPENAPGLTRRKIALEDMEIGAANCRFDDLDDRIRRRGDVGLGMIFQSFLAWPVID